MDNTYLSAHIFKKLFSLGWAYSLMGLCSVLGIFYATSLLGHIGTTELSASALISTILAFILTIFYGILYYVGIDASMYIHNKPEEFRTVFQSGLILATILTKESTF